MKNLKVKVSTLIFISIYLCILKSQYVGLSALVLGIIFILVTAKKSKNISIGPIIIFALFNIFLIASGLVSLLFTSQPLHDVLRDIVNFSMPSLCLLFGALFYAHNNNVNKAEYFESDGVLFEPIMNLVIVAVIAIVMQLFGFWSDKATVGIVDTSVTSFRSTFGTGYDAPMLALIFSFLVYRTIPKNSSLRIVFWLSCALMVVISFSRINILVVLFCCIVVLVIKRDFKLLFQISLGIFIFGGLFFFAIPSELRSAFILKISNSINEVSTSGSNFASWVDINMNWRGYEKYRVIQVMNNAGLREKLFGMGLGYRLPLPFEMKLAGDYYTSIPTIHTSYYYVFLKTGIVGLLMQLSMLLYLFKPFFTFSNSKCKLASIVLFFVLLIKGYTEGGLLSGQTAFLTLTIVGAMMTVPVGIRDREKSGLLSSSVDVNENLKM